MTKHPKGDKLRRFAQHKPTGKPLTLAADHNAVTEGRTLFPGRVVSALKATRFLKSGHNSRKIGRTVQKGRLKGAPIFTLTLEERKTCPSDCVHWRNCYGNKMHWPERVEGRDIWFQSRLWREVGDLSSKYPDGFLVRLHVLGDFFSLGYVDFWGQLLDRFGELNVYGYTSRSPVTPIGERIRVLRVAYDPRFAIRFSNQAVSKWGAITVKRPNGLSRSVIVCPAQTGKSDCCATCALCWTTPKNIAFLLH